MPKVKCALVQMHFSTDKNKNVEKGVRLIKEASANGAEIICLPELATTHYFCIGANPEYLDLAELVPGPASKKICKATAEANAYVIFPLFEKVQDGELYNTALFIDRKGKIVGKYRKQIIPFVKSGDIEGNEKYYFRPGNLGYPVFPTDTGLKVGITICFERHFPEGPRALALNGADVIFVPTATPLGGEMWEVELRAMAIANLLWVGAVNRVGVDEGVPWDIKFYGRSLWSAPNGEVVEAAGTEGDEIVYAEVDTEPAKQLREEWGFFRDRRPEAYAEVTAR